MTVILGAAGMLGRAFHEALPEAQGFDLPDFDVTDGDHIARALPEGESLVINCAAWTDVDGAETDEEGALQVNGAAVRMLAERCKKIGATLVHFSTDYVFDGLGTRPYPVDHPRAPLNAYGRTKAAGEAAIEEVGGAHLLIRTAWLYAPWGKNFVRTMWRLTGEKDELKVVADQRGRPTSAPWLAKATLKLIDKNARGTFHICDDGECTWHEFASAIAEARGRGCEVHPCTSEEFPRRAKRPPYSVLDLDRLRAEVGEVPPWATNLSETLDAIRRDG
ncbi:MAG: dTDP-4-dehydrorhamnose reductase [Myxococcota bacterium]